MTAALAAAARQRADQTRQRATEALQRLHATGQPITFTHVARTAGVSRFWLYRQPDLRAEIDRLRRATTTHAVPVPSPQRGSAESLRQRLEAASTRSPGSRPTTTSSENTSPPTSVTGAITASPTPSATCLRHDTPAQDHHDAKPSR